MSEPVTEAIQRALVAALGDAPRIGPFVVLLDDTSENPFRNYAAPAEQRAPSAAEVGDLTGMFRSAGRSPRLEFVEPNHGLVDALQHCGYTITRRLPLLALGSDGVVAPPAVDGAEVRAATDAELPDAAAVMSVAYGDDEPPERAAQRLRRTVERGGSITIAILDGEIVSTGLHSAPQLGLAEVAAVATLPHHRRRGLAALVSADLAAHAQAAGVQPYLQAESDTEARIYQRIGFERCGSLALADGR